MDRKYSSESQEATKHYGLFNTYNTMAYTWKCINYVPAFLIILYVDINISFLV